MQGLQLAEVLLGHPVPLVGLGDGAVNCEHGERAAQKELYFLPHVRGFKHGEVKVMINAMPGLDMDDSAPKTATSMSEPCGSQTRKK
jgi:hypothetical protein